MKISLITVVPDLYKPFLGTSLLHKAVQKGGNIMVEGNEQQYTSPGVDDLKYEIK